MTRFSGDPSDPGHDNWQEVTAAGKSLDIYLDGKKVEHVITADDVEGFVLVEKLDATGRPYLENGTFATERRTGKVGFKVVDRD